MNRMTKSFFILLACVVFAACSDDDNYGLPPDFTPSMATTFKDTSGKEIKWSAGTVIAATQYQGEYLIQGSNTNPNESFNLVIQQGTLGDHFAVIDAMLRKGENVVHYSSYFVTPYSVNVVSITERDSINHTISGTFQYELVNTMDSTDYIYSVDGVPGTFDNVPPY